VDNVQHWAAKLQKLAGLTSVAVETVRFDTQKMQTPEISGIVYQQGTLHGYEVREYLLEKYDHTCVYCGGKDVPLEIEHIIPRSRGGSDRLSNLTISCRPCNQSKNNRTAAEFGHPHLQAQASLPLKDVAAVNTTRYATGHALKTLGLPITFWSGGRTKYNRTSQGYAKDHWIDAACVGQFGADVHIPARLRPLIIRAVGRGSRQMCRMDRFGFPRTKPKGAKRVHGFQTGDMVKAVVKTGKKAGMHVGRVAIRVSGSFRVGKVDGISWRNCTLYGRADGYEYQA
jgi:hypothetical protein